MRLRAVIALCLLALALLGATPRDDSYSLIWKPTEGKVLSYALSTDISAEGYKVTMLEDIDLKITKVAGNGDYTVETAQKNMRIVADGKETKMPSESDKPTVEIFNAKGEQIGGDKEDESDIDEVTALLGQVGDFKSPDKPVAKGDKWSETVKADEKKKIRAAKIDYEVVGVDKIGDFDVVRISMAYKQTEGSKPATFEGTMSFDLKDMSLVQIEASIHDAPFDEGVTGDVKIKMIRQ